MKRRTFLAGAAVVAGGVVAGVATRSHETVPSPTTSGHERAVNLDADRYAKLLNGKAKIIGGLPLKEQIRINPDESAQDIIKSAGAYILNLKKDYEKGSLPKGVVVESNNDGAITEVINVTIESGAKPDKPGIHSVSLSALVDTTGKNTNDDSYGVFRIYASLGQTLPNGEFDSPYTTVESWKREGRTGGRWWQFGNDSSGQLGLVSSDTPNAIADYGQFLSTAASSIDDALSGAKAIIDQLKIQQRIK